MPLIKQLIYDPRVRNKITGTAVDLDLVECKITEESLLKYSPLTWIKSIDEFHGIFAAKCCRGGREEWLDQVPNLPGVRDWYSSMTISDITLTKVVIQMLPTNKHYSITMWAETSPPLCSATFTKRVELTCPKAEEEFKEAVLDISEPFV